MAYKIIATDLDGTLNNSEGKISKGNMEAIDKAVAGGVKFVICSGRSYHSIARYGEIAGLNKKGCFGIAFNGSVVYEADTMKILYEDRLKLDLALKTIDKIKVINPETPIMAYLEGNLVICEKDRAEIKGYATRSGIDRKEVSSFRGFLTKDVHKLIIKDDNHENLKEIYDKMINQLDKGCSMFFSDRTMLEFSTDSSNKAVGVKFLADHLGIDMKDVVAVGDNYNDMEMVKEAGMGIAVSNAVDALKEIADYITVSDNNNSALKEVVDYVL